MNRIHKAVTILGITTALGVLASTAYGNRGVARIALGNSSGAMEDLQKAAQLFRDQRNMAGYQQTQESIRMVEQSPDQKPSAQP